MLILHVFLYRISNANEYISRMNFFHGNDGLFSIILRIFWSFFHTQHGYEHVITGGGTCYILRGEGGGLIHNRGTGRGILQSHKNLGELNKK